ncbi:MAG TPA: DNA adenine methylase [Tepidisphaeraceae bacterium]|jgi:DNA adenine methylase
MSTATDMPITAIVPWFGSKRGMADRIARECCRADGRPPKSFWELCAGSMAVSIAMPRCSHHHAVDMHSDLINLARVIADPKLGPLFYRRLRRIVNHETLFHEQKTALADDANDADGGLFAVEKREQLGPVDRAIAYFIVSWQGRNGVAGTERSNYQPAVRWTSGGGHGGIRFANAVRSIPAWRRRLRDITILSRDIFEVLAKIEDEDGTVIYIDPPYVRDGVTRSGSCGYLHDFRPTDHTRLAMALKRFEKVRVVISYYDHPQLRAMYAGWTVVECTTQKNLHVQNRRGVGRCDAPEILLINGPSYASGTAA